MLTSHRREPETDDTTDVQRPQEDLDRLLVALGLDGEIDARGRGADVPSLDEDGLLRHRGRWVAISDAQIPVVRLLLDRFGRLVRDGDLLDAYLDAGGNGSRASMRSLVHRVGRRVGEIGLELRAVRGRGVVLDVRPHPPL